MPENKHVVMIGAENGALAGGKVGGVGDVLHYLPYALAELGWRVTVIIPSYGFLHQKNPSRHLVNIGFPFRGARHEAEFWSVESRTEHPLVQHVVMEHPWVRGEPIYFNDPSDRAFDRDASKYALFCSAVGQLLRTPEFESAVLHLHDWHAATLLLLKGLHSDFHHLHKFKSIYTIHNLGIQGNRPMRGSDSSLEAWFPELFINMSWIDYWKDHRYSEWTYTPMAVGIRFAHQVNTVSPSYAEEILFPSYQNDGYYGGEGLEGILRQSRWEHRLSGILNGCDYPEKESKRLTPSELFQLIIDELKENKISIAGLSWEDGMKRLLWLQSINPGMILTTVSRIVEQKVGMMCKRMGGGQYALDPIMGKLNEINGAYILLGTGTPEHVSSLAGSCRYHERFLYVYGFSEKIAQALYSSGNLFLMPSLYEPCGISQMIAMREGQPCVVHAVGGLKDTVWEGVNGFTFGGWTMEDKVINFIKTTAWAVDIYQQNPSKWKEIQSGAQSARFDWTDSARKYIEIY